MIRKSKNGFFTHLSGPRMKYLYNSLGLFIDSPEQQLSAKFEFTDSTILDVYSFLQVDTEGKKDIGRTVKTEYIPFFIRSWNQIIGSIKIIIIQPRLYIVEPRKPTKLCGKVFWFQNWSAFIFSSLFRAFFYFGAENRNPSSL